MIWNYNCGSCSSVGNGVFGKKLTWHGLCHMCSTVVVGCVQCSVIIITGEGCSSIHCYVDIEFLVEAFACNGFFIIKKIRGIYYF